MSHRNSLSSFALEVGPENRLVTHNIATSRRLMFSFIEDRKHAFIQPLEKRNRYLIRVRSPKKLADALVCTDRKDSLTLRTWSWMALRSEECHWIQRRVKLNRRKARRRRRRRRRDLLSLHAFQYESRYGAFLSVPRDRNVTLSRNEDRYTRFRHNGGSGHRIRKDQYS